MAGRVRRDTWRRSYAVWQIDMLRLQEEGIYPAAFSGVRSPVLMLHGAADPHPGRMICASLREYIPQLEYFEPSAYPSVSSVVTQL